MAQSIPIDVYQFLEERVGKEEAKKVAAAIEVGLDVIEKKAEAVALHDNVQDIVHKNNGHDIVHKRSLTIE